MIQKEYIKKDKKLAKKIRSLKLKMLDIELQIHALEEQRRELGGKMGLDIDFNNMVLDFLKDPERMHYGDQEHIYERVSMEGLQILLPDIREDYEYAMAVMDASQG